jgi:hypothetical protein
LKFQGSLKSPWVVVAFLCLLMSGLCCAQGDKIGNTINNTQANVSLNAEAYDIGLQAYLYFYPLVTMDITRRVMTNGENESEAFGPMNEFHHKRAYPPASDRSVVRLNFDTLYSKAWLNLTDGPMIVSVPDTEGRYYLLPMLDMWTDVFASPGKRTTGTMTGNFAIALQCWNGTLPAGVSRIDAPTPYVMIVGRTQTNGVSDYDAVHKVQDGYRITPLSQWGKEAQKPPITYDPTIDMKTPPLVQVNSMPASTFFTYAAEVIKKNPPHITDEPLVAQMKSIGIEPGKSFDFEKLDPATQMALEKATVDGLEMINESIPIIGKVVNGWSMNTNTMGVYGNYYLKRAVIAMIGLLANLPEDAIFPQLLVDANGKDLNGNNSYLLHFNKSELPPVNAFWSATMYDAQGFQVANELNRFAIGDRDNLTYNKDGSLDIYIQHGSPGPDKESNWLPAPKGPLSVVMRLYWPKMEALDGRWVPPAVKKLT